MAADEHAGNAEYFEMPSGIDFTGLPDRELADEIHRLRRREREISFQRRYLHGQLELARADLARRLTGDRPLELSRSQIDDLLDGVNEMDGV